MSQDYIQEFANDITDRVRSSLVEVSKYFDIEEALPLELTQKQLTQMLGCSTSTLERFLKFKDFPKIDRGKGTSVKYPRDAVREWYNSHWREFSE